MFFEYFTMVKTSPGFWSNNLLNQLSERLLFEIDKFKDDEIVIITSNRSALRDIIEISKDYPKEVFQVKIAGEDFYNNYVSLYECSNGDCSLIKEGYEYIFSIKPDARSKLDEDLLKKFENKVANLYQKIEQAYQYKVHLNLLFDEDNNEEEGDIQDLSIIVKYRTKDVCLIAKKQGLTEIAIDVEFFDEKGKPKLSEKESHIDKDEMIF